MTQTIGDEVPSAHRHSAHQKAVRFVVLIDAAGAAVARLFLDDLSAVAEFDGGAEEVAMMINGLQPCKGAEQARWDSALSSHTRAEREAADVYTLDL